MYRRTCPSYITDQKLHHTEPYVYSQMVAGPYAPRFGQAKNSWLTGTAAWTFYAASQNILGVKPAYDGLLLDPCLPKELSYVKITRKFRGSTYNIAIENRSGDEKGKVRVYVDGSEIEGQVIAPDTEAMVHEVRVVVE